VRRRLAYLVVWILATSVTMGASWLGLRSVLDAATPRRVIPLSATDLRRTPPPSTPPAPGPPRTTPPADPPPSTLTRPAGNATMPSLTPTPSSTPVDPSVSLWVEVSGGLTGRGFQRTFHLEGGDATVFVNQWECRLVSGRAQPGFRLVSTRYDLRSILVSFVSSGHVSRVMVTWRNHPYAEVTETVA
jgi:hypothetical protein